MVNVFIYNQNLFIPRKNVLQNKNFLEFEMIFRNQKQFFALNIKRSFASKNFIF